MKSPEDTHWSRTTAQPHTEPTAPPCYFRAYRQMDVLWTIVGSTTASNSSRIRPSIFDHTPGMGGTADESYSYASLAMLVFEFAVAVVYPN